MSASGTSRDLSYQVAHYSTSVFVPTFRTAVKREAFFFVFP
jgi:hypothetical protein